MSNTNKRKYERNVGDNIRKEARGDLQYKYADRKVLIGEVIDHLRYMGGMGQHDEQMVDDQILSTIKTEYGAEVHKELSELVVSPYGLTEVMSTAELSGIIGQFPLEANYTNIEEYNNRIKEYNTDQISLKQAWIKEKKIYKDRVEKAIGHILKYHVSIELWKSVKVDQPILCKQVESSTKMAMFKTRLRKAVDIANGTHDVLGNLDEEDADRLLNCAKEIITLEKLDTK